MYYQQSFRARRARFLRGAAGTRSGGMRHVSDRLERSVAHSQLSQDMRVKRSMPGRMAAAELADLALVQEAQVPVAGS